MPAGSVLCVDGRDRAIEMPHERTASAVGGGVGAGTLQGADEHDGQSEQEDADRCSILAHLTQDLGDGILQRERLSLGPDRRGIGRTHRLLGFCPDLLPACAGP